jgi:hypothetical protein
VTTLQLPLEDIPFSMRGSWLSLSHVVALHTRAERVHVISHQTGLHPVFAIDAVAGGTVVEARLDAAPERLLWSADAGEFAIAFERPDALRMRGAGLGLRLTDAVGQLTPFSGDYLFGVPGERSAVLTSYETGRRYRITALSGALELRGAEALGTAERWIELGGDGVPWEALLEELSSESQRDADGSTFDELVAARAAEFAEFADALAPTRSEHPAATLASYVLWSATVSPAGFLGREAVLMSKHWMDKVWSWDHCFNALALARSQPELALDQFLIPFDHQAATGALPDSVTHSEVLYNFVKPPIHGWAWGALRERLVDVDPKTVRDVYDRLSAWSQYWLDHRRAPGSKLPYYQHGNDSGWDNSTVFDRDRLVESPDLAAFLVLQLDELARLADELGTDDGDGWRAAAGEVAAALEAELWDGERLVARGVVDHGVASDSSLLTALPLLAAARLPEAAVAALVAKVERHLTEFGPATELVDSPHYQADGYWRGPIWAPSTYIIERGLRAAGADELADQVKARFQRLCEEHGFAENFDALTGTGLRDRAYTWTASVYLLFLAEDAPRVE